MPIPSNPETADNGPSPLKFNLISLYIFGSRKKSSILNFNMELTLDSNSEHVAQENRSFRRKKNPIFDCYRFNQMPYINQITEIAPYVLTYFYVTI